MCIGAVTKLYRCVDEVKIQAEVDCVCDSSKGGRRRRWQRAVGHPDFTPQAQFGEALAATWSLI